ncbi:hypothetical protein KPH14_007705 [Odynerus spinipes]|uniref:Gamma-tubulin complex component n=1 Tax=Odynerus spinipes TaxID=1348599 RepID=A0AAD9RIW1_9HYME|nr:hypothetical protein KPH14_007705 [Odynerus spinipes]
MSVTEEENVADLVHKMIISFFGEQKPELIRRFMRFSLELFSSIQGVETLREDEISVASTIKSKLSSQDAARFDKLHNDLRTGPLKNRISVLIFLLNSSQTVEQRKDKLFSFPDIKSGLNIPTVSVSGQPSQSSWTQAQIVSVNTMETNLRGSLINQNNIFREEYVSEDVLIQDLIYCFQGIEGKFLKLDSNYGFQIDPVVNISSSQKQAVLRLSELGYLYNTLRRSTERISAAGIGRVAESFVAVLQKELSEYYKFIAIMQEEINRAQNQLGYYGITLSHLHLWAYDPLETLKWLASVTRACQGQKGGLLASTIYEFSYHDGQLDDPYNEFFIETCADVAGDRMWHEKYQVRNSMVPSFITKGQAKKILGTGKSINFLREVCKDFSPWQGRNTEMFKNTEDRYNAVEIFLDMDPDGRLQTIMDAIYKETSTRVVEILTKQCHLLDHLQGIKSYLLLGQGHFIQHLMHLLEPELAKPANSLYPHNISSILETAIRATSTNLEDVDVQRRLDVRLLAPSDNETGWDIFILDYNVDGPIGTIFEPCSQTYQTVFFALWRAKRMESILSAIWKQQITSAKIFRKMPEILPIQNQIHLITSSMVHLVHQLQYYFLFEVIECSWDAFTKQLGQASSLDDIIAAHDQFVDTVRRGILLDEKSQELMDHLRSVYSPILDLQSLVETFLIRATQEHEARLSADHFSQVKSEQLKSWGRTTASDIDTNERQTAFLKYLNTLSIQLRLLYRTYQDRVKKFLLMLASAEDVSLQLLSVRLDFNEYYKRKDSRLVAPLTYQHRRQSDQSFLITK